MIIILKMDRVFIQLFMSRLSTQVMKSVPHKYLYSFHTKIPENPQHMKNWSHFSTANTYNDPGDILDRP